MHLLDMHNDKTTECQQLSSQILHKQQNTLHVSSITTRTSIQVLSNLMTESAEHHLSVPSKKKPFITYYFVKVKGFASPWLQ